jgi:uncharacterized protein YbbK (DUF523 family)
MKIVSACLVGINCKWDGKNKCIPKLKEKFLKSELLPLCAEQLGGLPTPRNPSGILNGTGEDVICGKCKVVNNKGEDVTKEFVKGAQEILRIAKETGIKEAILKKTSPSCGIGKTWQMSKIEGKFSNELVDGNGVLTALLKQNGIKVISEKDIYS